MGSVPTIIVSTGVDYVTATQQTNGGSTELGRLAAQWLADAKRQGNEIREWSSHGYHGLWAGSLGVATNGARLLVKIGGLEAQEHAKEILDHADSISRLDLQSTLRIPNVASTFAERLERQARRFKKKHHANFDIDLRRHDRKGKTLYLGSRTSERFIRIYDKGAESRHPDLRQCWRAEIQYGKPLAGQRAKELLSEDMGQRWVCSVVVYELARRGISWDGLLNGAVTVQPSQALHRQSDCARKLDWLRSQVLPTVLSLIDSGYEDEVRKVLNLSC